MAGGRPTTLTKELIAAFSELVPHVLYLETAGEILGVSRSTWYAWIRHAHKIDKLALKNEKLPEYRQHVFSSYDELCVEFLRAYRWGLAEGAAQCLKTIRASPSWRAHAWILERRFPELWGSDRRLVKQLERDIKQLAKTLQALQPHAPRLLTPPQDEQGASAADQVA